MDANAGAIFVSGLFPLMGGVWFTLVGRGVVMKDVRFKDPRLTRLWTDLYRPVCRWFGPFLIALGLLILFVAVTGWRIVK